ncbi:MAG: dTMP kinase [Candidatus Aenigmatarchaeota archaeon]|nr:MAG: dTMP kinase [Candidatus Aenigmarchaeota archaeon]
MTRGAFIAFEGMDGSGKSTVMEKTMFELSGNGYSIRWTAEPTHQGTGKHIRDRLNAKWPPKGTMSDLAAAAVYTRLFFADRIEHNALDIQPNLSKRINIFTDRSYGSTVAYQSAQGYPIEKLAGEVEWLVGKSMIERPDLMVVLDVSVPTALARLAKTGKKPDKFEDPEFLPKLHEAYGNLPKYLPNDRIEFVDAERPLKEVVVDVCSRIRPLLVKKAA